MKISVLGTGAWGIALALLLNDNGHMVTMWSKFANEIEELKKFRENKKLLPDVIIPEEIKFATDASIVKDSDAVLLSVPSFAISDVCEIIKPYLNDNQLIINAGKGLEAKCGLRFSQIISDKLCRDGIVVISGPTHAEEVSRKIPTSIVAASANEKNALLAQDLLMSEYMRVYVNDDVVGVELGGATKNVIALCAGICDGLGMGDNTKAALITRGLSEMTRLGMALGGKAETFMGLAGIGDLVVTCCSPHSRNHRAGELIGRGMTPEEAISQVGTVEGVYALKTIKKLSDKIKVELPIVNECYEVFTNGKSASEAINILMTRPKKSERF